MSQKPSDTQLTKTGQLVLTGYTSSIVTVILRLNLRNLWPQTSGRERMEDASASSSLLPAFLP